MATTADSKHTECNSSCALNFWRWEVNTVLQQEPTKKNYAVIVLNREITQHPDFVKKVWNNALIRVTVDGGTKSLESFLGKLSEEQRKSIKRPDLITGDFDSVTEELLDEYRKRGCKVIYTPDQNLTDFTKALIEVNIHSNALGTELDHILVFSQCSGRIDHMLGNLQTMFLAKTKKLINLNTKLYLLTDTGLSWLLSPGEHYIEVPIECRNRKKVWCSLIPIGEPAKCVTTTGLKWNLDHQPLQFGDIVSTSNTFDGSEIVTVCCSAPVLWSMKVPSVMDEHNTKGKKL